MEADERGFNYVLACESCAANKQGNLIHTLEFFLCPGKKNTIRGISRVFITPRWAVIDELQMDCQSLSFSFWNDLLYMTLVCI